MAERSAVLLTAGQVLTGRPGERIADGAVLVEGIHIRAVGTRSEVCAETGEQVPELSYPDATILPGLIDAHVHLSFTPGPDVIGDLSAADETEFVLAMAGRAQRMLERGITTVRDLGDRDGLTLRLRDAIGQGAIAGPRILCATAPLTPRGGHCWFLGGEVEGEQQTRVRVRSIALDGADVIKVMVSGGQLTLGGAEMWESQFDAAMLRAIVEEAHTLCLPVAAHAHGTESIRLAVEAGVDTIEHCTWLVGPRQYAPDEQVAAQIAAAGIAVCPAHSGDWRRLAGAIGEDAAKRLVGRTRWLADRGVRLIAGTDAGLNPVDTLPLALQRHQEFGFTAEQIIEMATTAAAEALRRSDITGRVAAGLEADLLVVPGDPLSDLGALDRPLLVLARGRSHCPPPDQPYRQSP